MSVYLTQAYWLMARRRYAEAQKTLGRAIAEEPRDANIFGTLAICLLEQGEHAGAQEAARDALACDADSAFGHYALARVLFKLKRYAAAQDEADKAIRLSPENVELRACRAGQRYDLRDWQRALESAEAGLRLDPTHEYCLNLHALALIKLERLPEARDDLQRALQLNAGNSFTHCNMGWLCLHDRSYRDAMEHFRITLRLDPDRERGRQGMIEALKARYWPYRIYLQYVLDGPIARERFKWVGVAVFVIIALQSVVHTILRPREPQDYIMVLPLMLGLGSAGFSIFIWLAHPVFNVMLLVHPLGRLALSEPERVGALMVGFCLVAGTLLFALGPVLNSWRCSVSGLVLLFGCLPSAAVVQQKSNVPFRYRAGGVAAIIGVSAIGAFFGRADMVVALWFVGGLVMLLAHVHKSRR